MVRSMTGYGRYEIAYDSFNITSEVRTVNHRYLNIHIHAPHSFLMFEDEIKDLITNYFSRGKIDVYIHIEGRGTSLFQIAVNWDLLDQYIHQLKKIQARYHLKDDLSIEMLTSFSDLFIVHQNETIGANMKDQIYLCVKKACANAQKERNREGDHLRADLKHRLHRIANIVQMIKENQPQVITNYQKKITERIHTLIEEPEIIDHVRLHQEVAFLVEKGDITEELIRLESHIMHCNKILESEHTVGRKLDFTVQEIQRELNTIGSKAIDYEVSHLTIEAKGELEKMREQIQNIE